MKAKSESDSSRKVSAETCKCQPSGAGRAGTWACRRAPPPGLAVGPRPSAGVVWPQAAQAHSGAAGPASSPRAASTRGGGDDRGARRAPASPYPRARKRAHAPPRVPTAPGTRGALPPGPGRPGPFAPLSPGALLPGRTHPPWLSSSGPGSLRVFPRRSRLSSWTGATWEWGTWGQRVTSAGRWPWRRSGQPQADRTRSWRWRTRQARRD